MDWFELWCMDRENMAEIMTANMQADLDAGYDPNGMCIRRQGAAIFDYKQETERLLEKLAAMAEKQCQRWCYFNMKMRGVI